MVGAPAAENGGGWTEEQRVKKILIIKPSSLGDIVHGLVVAQSIREQMPGCALTWVAAQQFAPLVRRCSTVDDVLVFQRRGGFFKFVRLLREIRRRHYDLTLDFQGLARSGVMTRLARTDLRLGRSDAREGAWLAYQTKVPRPVAGPMAHAIEVLMEFLPLLGLERRLGSPIQLRSEPLEAQFEAIVARQPILLAPHSRQAWKEWPRFPELTLGLRRQHPDVPVVWCSHQPCATPPALASDSGFHNLTGQTSLSAMITLIQQARLVVANDSGPMHLAAAVGTPVVACFGPTPPERFGPYPLNRPTHRVLRAPGNDLSQLAVSAVSLAIEDLLGQPALKP